MTRILCNLPLECFDDRASFAAEGIELVTYGPPTRMVVDGVRFGFDVAFDPSRGTIEELLAALPPGFAPDFVLVYWPDQEPLPRGAERCPVPVVGVVSDYNLTLPLTAGLWPFFDVLLCDRGGVELHRALGFADVRPFVQYSFKAPFHHTYGDEPRTIDVGFAGSSNPLIHGRRMQLVERLRALRACGLSVEVRDDVRGEAYGRLLSRCKIGFNRSLRGELNLRAFEVPACGALLLVEDTNLEVREMFEPGEEVVLYAEETLEETVLGLCADEPRRARITRAGAERVREYRMSKRIRTLADMLAGVGVQRPASTAAECARGRARSLAWTWAEPTVRMRDLVAAHDLAPADPRVLNDLAVQMLALGTGEFAARAVGLLQRALAADPSYVPAAENLAWLARRGGDVDCARRCAREAEARSARARSLASLDGLRLPPGFTEPNLAATRAFADALWAQLEPTTNVMHSLT